MIERWELPEFLKNNEPQIKAPRVTPLEGVSTYAPQIKYLGLLQ